MYLVTMLALDISYSYLQPSNTDAVLAKSYVILNMCQWGQTRPVQYLETPVCFVLINPFFQQAAAWHKNQPILFHFSVLEL